MRCSRCGNLDDKVIDSRMSKDGCAIRRRRECLDCGNRFTTYEEIERSDLRIMKRDGRREPFDKKKLLGSIVKACEKRAVGIEQMEHVVEKIVSELQHDNVREVPSSVIGSKLMTRLQDLDPVAYVRYASVYRAFQDVGEFLDEIESLERRPVRDTRQQELFK